MFSFRIVFLAQLACARSLVFIAVIGLSLQTNVAFAQQTPAKADYRFVADIKYAQIEDHVLLLDLYLPNTTKQAPLIVWVHGGAWRSGSKESMPLKWLVPKGFAVASVDYRLSPVARFPAQVHDCKAAIRFLRGEQAKYGYDARRIAVAGSSAGGHLVALIGTTNHHPELEGRVGGYLDQPSTVEAVVDYFGPTNFMTILKQSTPHGLSVRVPALELLLGDRPENKRKLAQLASPVFHVDPRDPPILMIHGDQDPQVPINQSHELHGVCKRKGVDVHLEVVHDGAHGGKLFYDKKRRQLVEKFCIKHLRDTRRGPNS